MLLIIVRLISAMIPADILPKRRRFIRCWRQRRLRKVPREKITDGGTGQDRRNQKP